MQATSIKTKNAGNKFPWKKSAPGTENCECNNYSVKVDEVKFGCDVPRSMVHGLTNIAELLSDRFLAFSWKIYPVFHAKTMAYLRIRPDNLP